PMRGRALGVELRKLAVEALRVVAPRVLELALAQVNRLDIRGHRKAQPGAVGAIGEVEVVEMEAVEGIRVEADAPRRLAPRRDEDAVERLHATQDPALEAHHRRVPSRALA